MRDLKWVVNRAKAMKPQEIFWRFGQKRLVNKEKEAFFSLNQPVYEIPLCSDYSNLHIDVKKLSINWDNKNWTSFSELDLFGVFDYQKYKNKWNAGFQTENYWPEDLYSPTINISQRVDIGDIRTNWELNRHFQFAALAKSYYCTGEEKYYSELKELFYDWNNHNHFLHGVEWTSAMEVAIRVNSWVYTYAFLKKTECEEELLKNLEHGILVMVEYVLKHRARFSSANNHLIVEMYSVALVGIIADCEYWKNEALKILTEELPRQNYSDGVNKEMSLHYQSFVMEAYGLLWLLMLKNKIYIPEVWKTYLTAMSEFVADSTDDFGLTMEFGDSDEGKVLDLCGTIDNHYSYVLNLMSCILDKKYTDSTWHENLNWVISETLKKEKEKEKYVPGLVCSRKEGGYTFLRSKDRRVLIGIDHADLGYGSIAAHGHADALSFQMFVDGKPIFVDSGTYNYHVTPKDRDYFRSTAAHNTVVIEGCEQSEMLGPFIWGIRAKSILNSVDNNSIIAQTSYKNKKHTRLIKFEDKQKIIIKDQIDNDEGCFCLHLGFKDDIQKSSNEITIHRDNIILNIIFNSDKVQIKNIEWSPHYNNFEKTDSISTIFKEKLETTISWEFN